MRTAIVTGAGRGAGAATAAGLEHALVLPLDLASLWPTSIGASTQRCME